MNDNKIEQKQSIFQEDTLNDMDIKNILHPEDTKITATLDEQILEEEYFIRQYPYSKPLLNNKPEFFSSKEERVRLAKPRLADMVNRKIMQKRMRFIILADIVLFIVILGVIYPSLRRLQTSGKLNGYRFSLKQSFDKKALMINVVAKIERLTQTQQQAQKSEQGKLKEEFQIEIKHRGLLLLQEERPMPKMGSPVSYALFLIPYKEMLNNTKNKPNNDGLDILIRTGGREKKFFLQLPLFSQVSQISQIY